MHRLAPTRGLGGTSPSLPGEIAKVSTRLDAIGKELATAYERWEALAEG